MIKTWQQHKLGIALRSGTHRSHQRINEPSPDAGPDITDGQSEIPRHSLFVRFMREREVGLRHANGQISKTLQEWKGITFFAMSAGFVHWIFVYSSAAIVSGHRLQQVRLVGVAICSARSWGRTRPLLLRPLFSGCEVFLFTLKVLLERRHLHCVCVCISKAIFRHSTGHAVESTFQGYWYPGRRKVTRTRLLMRLLGPLFCPSWGLLGSKGPFVLAHESWLFDLRLHSRN